MVISDYLLEYTIRSSDEVDAKHIAARGAVQRRVAGMLRLRFIDRPARMLTSINATEPAFVYRDLMDVARSPAFRVLPTSFRVLGTDTYLI
jgi:hypothetical protein